MMLKISIPPPPPPPSFSPSDHLKPNPLLPISTPAAYSSPAYSRPSTTYEYYNTVEIRGRRTRRSAASSLSDNQTVVAAPTKAADESPSLSSAVEVVRNFYGGINRHDLASVEGLIAVNCVYEDLIFSQPFVGRKAILEFFQKFIDSISMDLQFVIDDISDEDTSALGVTWHLEWKGKPFPFSKGCSFYRLDVVDGKRQIIYGRDSVEPAIKPGEMALVAIRGVTWLLQRFPQLADQL